VNSFWIAALLVLWLVTGVLAALVLGLLRRIAPILERAETMASSAVTPPPGLSPGTTVPSFELTKVGGGTVTSAGLLGTGFVMLFVSSGCRPCRKLAEEIRRGDPSGLAVELIVVADESDVDAELGQWPSATLTFQRGQRVSSAFRTSATPHGFAIDSAGTVLATAFPSSLETLRFLADRVGFRRDASRQAARSAVPA
jgi:hypothetical protein